MEIRHFDQNGPPYNQLLQHFQVRSTGRAEAGATELLFKIKILTVLSGIFILWLIEI